MNKKFKLYYPLFPLSILYGAGVYFRNKLFDFGILKSRDFDIPIICIGNLSVGGTGKTPHTEYLIRLLSPKFNVAVLSRGYKRKSKGFQLADKNSTPQQLGDEPYQIFRKFPQVTVAVDADRCHGIEALMNCGKKTDVILLDDAYQHRYVKPGLTILLSDYSRPFYKDLIMPAGRLREKRSGKNRADICIITKTPQSLTESQANEIITESGFKNTTPVLFSSLKYDNLRNVFTDEQQHFDTGTHAVILTGIAQPVSMVEYLRAGFNIDDVISLPDHHDFSTKDVGTANSKLSSISNNNGIIIVTEKDAVKLRTLELSDLLRKKLFYLPLEIVILHNKTLLLNNLITDYVTENQRNS